MKLSELRPLTESSMSDLHLQMQEKILDMFKVSEDDAVDILDFALGSTDLEDLSQKARERLFTYYEQHQREVNPTARLDVQRCLKKDLGL